MLYLFVQYSTERLESRKFLNSNIITKTIATYSQFRYSFAVACTSSPIRIYKLTFHSFLFIKNIPITAIPDQPHSNQDFVYMNVSK